MKTTSTNHVYVLYNYPLLRLLDFVMTDDDCGLLRVKRERGVMYICGICERRYVYFLYMLQREKRARSYVYFWYMRKEVCIFLVYVTEVFH